MPRVIDKSKPFHYYEYLGYIPDVEKTEEGFYGKVWGISDVVSFEGTNMEECLNDFHDAVDAYLLFCEQEDHIPNKPPNAYEGLTYSTSLHTTASAEAKGDKQ